MTETTEKPPDFLQISIDMTLYRGQRCAKAILQLDPNISEIDENDLAFGYNVGSGADVVAFKELGFKRAIVTNNQGFLYRSFNSTSADREKKALDSILEHFSPKETQFSLFELSDCVKVKSFSPRLVTILGMEPSCFSEDGTLEYADDILMISKQNPKATIVLSAYCDHPLSDKAFVDFSNRLDKVGVNHQLFIDIDRPEVGVLGERILAIKGI
jgi:hypothetical protein